MDNKNMSHDLLWLTRPELSQEEAFNYLESINFEFIPGLTDQQALTLLKTAFPDTPITLNDPHNEDWLDDDSVSDDEKLAWINAHCENMK